MTTLDRRTFLKLTGAGSGGESRQIRAQYGAREHYTRWVLEAFDR